MNPFIYFLQKTVGQKMVVALTGLGLCLFVFIHMAGNLLILSGPKAYNLYAHKLHEIPGFLIFEIGLLFFFAGHILLSALLLIKNKRARGTIPYQTKKTLPFSHRLLWLQAGVLLVFLVFHLLSFKFGPYYEISLEGQKMRDLYRLVTESFKKPLYTIGYSLALFILFIHLLRGFSASFKSLGLSHPVYVSFIEKLSWAFTLIVIIGFLIPIWYIFIWL